MLSVSTRIAQLAPRPCAQVAWGLCNWRRRTPWSQRPAPGATSDLPVRSVAVMSGSEPVETAQQAKNVLGGELECCCKDPLTGWARDGYCRVTSEDFGVHAVCAQVTEEFLEFTKSRGNDLSTPRLPGFPGLQPGDRWCLCASRWKEAYEAGKAPKVVLAATDAKALETIPLEVLQAHAA